MNIYNGINLETHIEACGLYFILGSLSTVHQPDK